MIQAVGGFLQMFGQLYEARMASREGKMQDKIARYNARQLEAEADARMYAARLEQSRVARISQIREGEAIARVGASGVEIQGSPLEVLADHAYQSQMDSILTLRAGMIDATGMRSQAGVERAKGRWARIYGRQKARAGYLGAIGTGLGTVANLDLSKSEPKNYTQSLTTKQRTSKATMERY